ncbi:hypothetical protein EDB83DRAFT_2532022 [Lactarius deliciosus]|nr:hypothetical protein EDB83DRAFT_2532022 [Lactarius deliciosus]
MPIGATPSETDEDLKPDPAIKSTPAEMPTTPNSSTMPVNDEEPPVVEATPATTTLPAFPTYTYVPPTAPVPPTTMAAVLLTGSLKGTAPNAFTRDHGKSNQFLREFRQYKRNNRMHEMMISPYARVGLALSFICGDAVDDWIDVTFGLEVNTDVTGMTPRQQYIVMDLLNQSAG